MATEKILIFDEAGNAKRMKVRIARFLDNEPVTASDKTNIRTTLDVDDSLSGTFTTPLSVTSASDSSFTGGGKVGIGTASPNANCEIDGGSSGSLKVGNGTQAVRLYADADEATVLADGAVDMRFYTSGSEKMRLDTSGRVGIGTASPSSYDGNADDLAIQTSGHTGLTIRSSSTATGNVNFADGTSGDERYRGYIKYDHNGPDALVFGTAATERWRINSSGNLVANSTGIDFGAVATSAGDGTNTTGSASNSVLSDYEFGSWTPSFSTSGAAFTNPPTMDVIVAQYVKVGRHVHCQAYIRTDNVDTTGASGTVVVDGLPFVSDASSGNSGTLNVGYSASWVNAPASGYTQPDGAFARLTRYSTSGASTITPSDLTAGASANQNELIFSISYISKT